MNLTDKDRCGVGFAPWLRHIARLDACASRLGASLLVWFSPARLRRYALFVVIGTVVITFSVLRLSRFPMTTRGEVALQDLSAHLTAGRLLVAGRAAELYDVAAQEAAQRALLGDHGVDLYISPPFAALLYAPFAPLSFGRACVAWLVVSLALYAAMARVARPVLHRLAREHWGLVLLAAAASPPFAYTLKYGQDTPVSLFLWIAGTRLALSRRDVAAGVVFALGLFKPQLFLMPPLVLLALGRPRALGAWLATALGVAALSLRLVGLAGVIAWAKLLSSPEYVEHIRNYYRWNMHSLPSFLASIAPRALVPLADAAGVLAGLALCAATFLAVRRLQRAGRAFDERAAWALASCATVLTSPHLLSYDMMLLVWPVLLALELGVSATISLALLGMTLLLWTGTLRHDVFGSHPWPGSILAASWTAPLVLLLWRELRRALLRDPRHDARSADVVERLSATAPGPAPLA